MKQSLLSSWHSVTTTLAMTVGSPSAHRRGTMLKHVAFLLLFLFAGFGQMWGGNVTWEQVAWGNITTSDVIIVTVTTSNGTYLLEHSHGTSETPKLGNTGTLGSSNTTCTFSENDDVKWKKDASNRLCKASDGTKWLYTAGSNNGMRVGTTTTGNTWTLDGDYIKSNANRYLSVYGTTDFRSYTSKQSGQVTRFYKAASCSGTKLGTPVVTAEASNKQVRLTWPAVSNASGYQLKWNGGDWAAATSPVTKTGLSNGTAYTYQVKAIGNGSTYCDGDASAAASATPNVYYTVTWNNNGAEYTTTQVVSGQRPTFPEAPGSCDTGEGASTTFYGWATSTWSGKAASLEDSKLSGITIYTQASDMPTVTGNGVVYNAVFCKGSASTWDKVTSAPSDWSGEYVITNSGGANAMISDFHSGTSGEFKSASVTITGTQITSTPTDKMIWIVERKGATGDDASKYSFQNKSTGTYAEITASSSTNAALNASAVWFTIASSSTSGVWKVNSVTYSGRCFAWYSSNSTFRTYANSSNTTGNLYKKNGGATSEYMTTCCTPLAPINGSFNRIHF